MPSSNPKSFKEIYSEAVEEALTILGESTTLVTSYLEKKYKINLLDTANNPTTLSEALDAAIDGGARVVQRRILRLIYEKMDFKPASTMSNSLDFAGKVMQAKKDFETNGEEKK